jgi:hypothetical protein
LGVQIPPFSLIEERWPRGLWRFPAKKERLNNRRGFKSLSLRFPPIAQLVECLCEEQEAVSSILTWGIALPHSSTVELHAVNVMVVGSSPTEAAIFQIAGWTNW